VLERRSPNEEEILGIVTGETFEYMGFDNFVADDFFAWAVGAADLLRSLAVRITSAYDLTAIREDLLKELYQELVDPQTRHDLGEFYTPDWLAELTLRKAGFPSTGASLLDPACGSGTFLFIAVRLLREAGLNGEELVEFCANNLAGMDVHPLAVTIAKTNLVLALGDDLRQSRRRFRLPIYMADALTVSRERIDAIPIPVDTEAISRRTGKRKTHDLPPAFWLPADLADRPGVLHEAINALLEFANPAIHESTAHRGFAARLQELGIDERNRWLWYSNLRLMRWLLCEPATDTVWRFVLQNAYQPEMLARRKFAFVIGNPPWLSYRFIRKPDYQERVRELVFRYRLLDKHDWHLFTQIEMATLFFAFCADRYLAEGGTLAFVMPRSVLTGAKQHDQFRCRFVASAERLIDCEKVAPLFNVPSCVVVWKKEGTAHEVRHGVPMLCLEGKLPGKNVNLVEAWRFLSRSETSHVPPAAARPSPYLDCVVNGATIYPRCFWFVRPSQTAVIIDRERPQLETDLEKIERAAKRPWKDIRLSGSVEADFLFVTLLSNDLLPFGKRRFSIVVLPVAWQERTAREGSLIDIEEAVSRGKIGLAEWLRKAEAKWLRHRKSQRGLLECLNWMGKLTSQHPIGVWKVVYNMSGTHICSCVIDANIASWEVEGLSVRGFVADKTTYWYETLDENEAYYLSAVLNSPIVDRTIKPFQTKGAFGASRGRGERDIMRRPFEVLPIPLYDANNEKHRRLAGLGRRCHAKVVNFVENADPQIFEQPIGKLRQQIRRELLPQELAEIDTLVKNIL
jgi:methylase of polypeptide subunit release factors